MTTRLPDFPDMGTVTLAEAERIAVNNTGGNFGAATSDYVNAALAVLPTTNARRRDYQVSLVERVREAQETVARVKPILAGTFPATPGYRGTFSAARAEDVVRRIVVDWTLKQLVNDYALSAVQALGEGSEVRRMWSRRVEGLLAGERWIAENGKSKIQDLDRGPQPAP